MNLKQTSIAMASHAPLPAPLPAMPLALRREDTQALRGSFAALAAAVDQSQKRSDLVRRENEVLKDKARALRERLAGLEASEAAREALDEEAGRQQEQVAALTLRKAQLRAKLEALEDKHRLQAAQLDSTLAQLSAETISCRRLQVQNAELTRELKAAKGKQPRSSKQQKLQKQKRRHLDGGPVGGTGGGAGGLGGLGGLGGSAGLGKKSRK